jgi:hypothetical protein
MRPAGHVPAVQLPYHCLRRRAEIMDANGQRYPVTRTPRLLTELCRVCARETSTGPPLGACHDQLVKKR